jgi:hypothetical protein
VGVIESVSPSEAEGFHDLPYSCDCKSIRWSILFLTWRTYVSSEHDKEAICKRMVLVCGTSTCHMAVSRSKLFIPGIWGPFWSGRLLYSPFYQLNLNLNLNPGCHCTSFVRFKVIVGSYHGKSCSLDVNTTSVENCSFNWQV